MNSIRSLFLFKTLTLLFICVTAGVPYKELKIALHFVKPTETGLKIKRGVCGFLKHPAEAGC